VVINGFNQKIDGLEIRDNDDNNKTKSIFAILSSLLFSCKC